MFEHRHYRYKFISIATIYRINLSIVQLLNHQKWKLSDTVLYFFAILTFALYLNKHHWIFNVELWLGDFKLSLLSQAAYQYRLHPISPHPHPHTNTHNYYKFSRHQHMCPNPPDTGQNSLKICTD